MFTGQDERDSYNLIGRISPGGVGEPPVIGDLEMLRAYYKNPWMRAVTHRISYAVGSTEWQLYTVKQGGKTVRARDVQRATTYKTRQKLLAGYKAAGELVPITDHPFIEAIDNPNPFMVGLTMRRLDCLYKDLLGESFLLKERNAVGMISGFWPIPPNWIRLTPTPTRPSYMVGFRGWQGEIPDTEIVWTTDANPENPYGRGRGFGTALEYDIDIEQYSARTMAAKFYNGAVPPLIVTVEGAAAPELQRIQQDWQNQHQGFWRAFKTHFVNRKIDVKETNQSFADLGVVQLRQSERDTFLQVFGVPPEVCGVVTNSNRATIEAATYIMALLVTVPRLETYRAEWQARILPEYDERLILDYVSPVTENDDYILEVMKASPWAFLVDDWRIKANFGPLGDKGEGATLMIPALMNPTDPSEMPTATANQPATQPAAGKEPDWQARALAARAGSRPKAA